MSSQQCTVDFLLEQTAGAGHSKIMENTQPNQLTLYLKYALFTLGGSAIFLGGVGGAYFWRSHDWQNTVSLSPTPVPTQTTAASTNLPDSTVVASPLTQAMPDSYQASWQTVTSSQYGYTLQVPSTWKVEQNTNVSVLTNQDYAVNYTISSDKSGIGQAADLNAVTIAFPISIAGPHKDQFGKQLEQGLTGLKAAQKQTNLEKSLTTEDANINGLKALTVTITSYDQESELPSTFAGEYCLGCTTKNVYIDLNNGKILEIMGKWKKDDPEFETTFDQIIKTFSVH